MVLVSEFAASNWSSGATGKLRVTNADDLIVNSWHTALTLDYPITQRSDGEYEVAGAEIVRSSELDNGRYQYVFSPSDFNSSLSPGESAVIIYNTNWDGDIAEPIRIILRTRELEEEREEVFNYAVTPWTDNSGSSIYVSINDLESGQDIFSFSSTSAISETIANGEVLSTSFDGNNYQYTVQLSRVNDGGVTYLGLQSAAVNISVGNFAIAEEFEPTEIEDPSQFEISEEILRWSHNSGSTVYLSATNNRDSAIANPVITFESNFQMRGKSTDIWGAEVVSEVKQGDSYLYTLRLDDSNFEPNEDFSFGFNTLEANPELTFQGLGENPVIPDPDPLPEPDPLPTGGVARPDYNTSTGFFVDSGKLYDANGQEFIIRGVNNRHVWFDSWGGGTPAKDSLDNIAGFGFNSVRIVWEIDITDGRGGQLVTDDRILQDTIETAIANKLVPMVELHDFTGRTDTSDLLNRGVGWWIDRADMWGQYEESLIINIANEFGDYQIAQGASRELFPQVYIEAINRMRNAGIKNTLVIDSFYWGKDASLIVEYGEKILNADPEKNVMFSVHFYEGDGQDADAIRNVFDSITGEGLPLIIGEYGNRYAGTGIRHDVIIEEAERHGVGDYAWAWEDKQWSLTDGNTWEANSSSELTQFGRDVVAHVQRDGELATIF